MKNVLLAMILLLAFSVLPAHAKEVVPELDNWKDDIVVGAKFDAPNIVRLNDNWSIGMEVSKDLNQTGIQEGWVGYGKLTYTGSLINLSAGKP